MIIKCYKNISDVDISFLKYANNNSKISEYVLIPNGTIRVTKEKEIILKEGNKFIKTKHGWLPVFNNKKRQIKRIQYVKSVFNDNSVLKIKYNKSKEILNNIIQNYLICPISHEIMKEPYILLGDQQTYEKEYIEKWLQKKKTSPYTNIKLSKKHMGLVENRAIKYLIEYVKSFADNI